MPTMRANKLTVPLDADQREFVERTAAREDRPMASVVRRLVEAARTAAGGEQHAA